MKKMLICLLVFILVNGIAVADTFVSVEVENDSLTAENVKDFSVAFFAEKFGIEKDGFENANWDITYGHSSVDASTEAYWSVSVSSIAHHERIHYLKLSGSGDVIYWEAHGPGYEQIHPELLDSAVVTAPLDSDIQKDEVIQLVTEQMISLGYCDSVEGQQLTTEAYFVYDDHFNSGKIPVWLVKIECHNGNLWKAAITHNGVILSLTEYDCDYTSYTTPWGRLLD